MGWFSSDHPDHEGFAVALVERHNVRGGSGLYRELQYPNDDNDRADIARVQAGCECGWRSPYFRDFGACYAPFIVCLSERGEERVRILWREHIDAIPRERSLQEIHDSIDRLQR